MSVSHEHIYLLGFLSYCSTVSLVSTRCTAYCIAPRSLSVVRACHTKYYTIPARRSKAKSKTSGMLKPPCLALGQKITRYGGCYWLLPLCTELPPRCCGSRVGWYASAFAVSSLSPPPETRRLTAVYCTYTTTTHGVSGGGGRKRGGGGKNVECEGTHNQSSCYCATLATTPLPLSSEEQV